MPVLGDAERPALAPPPGVGDHRDRIGDVGGQLEHHRVAAPRIEDDVVVTPTGYELLSAGAPRQAADVEKAMRSRVSSRQ